MKLIASCFTCILVLVLYVATSHAVPAFSRAHKVECTTCHTIYPELNEYGDAFLKNSYVYVGKNSKSVQKTTAATASVPAPKPSPAGDAPVVKGEGDAGKLSRLKAGALGAGESPQSVAVAPAASITAEPAETQAEGMLLAGIPEQLPISFTGSINYLTGDRKNMGTGGNDVDFAARSFKLHAAGNFRDKVGFFATYVAYSEQETGGNTSNNPSNNKTDINEFFIQWRQVTTLKRCKPGSKVNLEVDLIARYVERMLSASDTAERLS